MMASMMGAIAFQKGLGLTHSCAHAHAAAAGLMLGDLLDLTVSDRARAPLERDLLAYGDPLGAAGVQVRVLGRHIADGARARFIRAQGREREHGERRRS